MRWRFATRRLQPIDNSSAAASSFPSNVLSSFIRASDWRPAVAGQDGVPITLTHHARHERKARNRVFREGLPPRQRNRAVCLPVQKSVVFDLQWLTISSKVLYGRQPFIGERTARCPDVRRGACDWKVEIS